MRHRLVCRPVRGVLSSVAGRSYVEVAGCHEFVVGQTNQLHPYSPFLLSCFPRMGRRADFVVGTDEVSDFRLGKSTAGCGTSK